MDTIIGNDWIIGWLGFFVGLEMRQSQQTAIAGQVQARNEAFLTLYLTMIGEDPIGRSLAAWILGCGSRSIFTYKCRI